MSSISIQMLVVSAVIAESALENAGAIIPIVNSMSAIFPINPSAINPVINESPLLGNGIPFWLYSIIINIPSAKKRKLIGINIMP